MTASRQSNTKHHDSQPPSERAARPLPRRLGRAPAHRQTAVSMTSPSRHRRKPSAWSGRRLLELWASACPWVRPLALPPAVPRQWPQLRPSPAWPLLACRGRFWHGKPASIQPGDARALPNFSDGDVAPARHHPALSLGDVAPARHDPPTQKRLRAVLIGNGLPVPALSSAARFLPSKHESMQCSTL